MISKYGTEEASSEALLATLDYCKYHLGCTTPYSITIENISPEFFAETRAFLESLALSEVTVFKHMDAADNRTVFQNSCTDTVFIELPNPTNIDESGDLLVTFPERGAVCQPYTDKAAETPRYKVSSIPKYQYPLIEGVATNSTYELHSNEQKYYDALIDWINYNVENELGEDKGIIDAESEEYMRSLIEVVYPWHWSHNPDVPLVDTTADSESAGDAMQSKYVFTNKFGAYGGAEITGSIGNNATLELLNFVKKAAVSIGYKAYPLTIIQLLRWGERKPTFITLPDFDMQFNLGDGTVTECIGNIDDYSYVHGYEVYEIVGLIVDDSVIGDPKFKYTSGGVVGFALGAPMINKVNDKKMHKYKYLSMIDAVRAISANKISVKGVTYNNGTWSVEQDSIADYYVMSLSDVVKVFEHDESNALYDPVYRSDEMLEMCMSLQSFNVKAPSQLKLIHDLFSDAKLTDHVVERSFRTAEELKQKISQYLITSPAEAVQYSIVRVLIPVFEAAGYDAVNPDTSLAQLLTRWENSIKEVGYQGETDATKPEAVTKEPEVRTQTITSFGATNTTPVVPATAAQATTRTANAPEQAPVTTAATASAPAINIFKQVPPDSNYYLLLGINGEVIGGFAADFIHITVKEQLKKLFRFTLVDKATIDSVPPERIVGKESIVMVIPWMLSDLSCILKNRQDIFKLFFKDQETMDYYKVAINEMCKGVKNK
ncbi:hypothetical protein [Acetivibrio ethanolgignens]|uniref:Uncharacterized protein n=1 Tax=Acetivibrio ethanolgignens TaxID=290052 RepID=A0A0V8QBP0_9FIRM|nr:hypothetical protein [Acetivibrio ethanolgignens]KSV57908.1 hypothetical protein ASU35_14950 [Acetivibrio ethanolgignens]